MKKITLLYDKNAIRRRKTMLSIFRRINVQEGAICIGKEQDITTGYIEGETNTL